GLLGGGQRQARQGGGGEVLRAQRRHNGGHRIAAACSAVQQLFHIGDGQGCVVILIGYLRGGCDDLPLRLEVVIQLGLIPQGVGAAGVVCGREGRGGERARRGGRPWQGGSRA